MTLVLKLGGHDLEDPRFVAALVGAVAGLDSPPVIVHGGGPEVARLQEKFGITPRKVEGLRVTDEESLALAEMALSGGVNKRLVAALNLAGVEAIGLSGVDRGLVRAERIHHPAGDLGRVGVPVVVRADVLHGLVEAGVVPIISPISLGPDGAYNVNADQVAAAIAQALGAAALVFVTDVPGVLVGGQVRSALDADEAVALIEDGTINGGMIPKVRAALGALALGVREVHITDLSGLGGGAGTMFRLATDNVQHTRR
jgi:acetylglutamate kinase